MLSHNFSLFQCHIYNYNHTYFSTIKNMDFNSTMINYRGNCMVTQHIMILEFITSKFISKAILELQVLSSFFAHLDKLYTCPGIHGQNCIAEGRKDNIRDRVSLKNYSWFATTWQGGHVGGQNKRIFPRRIYMKIELSSQRRKMLLFLTTNMAAVTSRANTGLKLPCKANLVPRVLSVPVEREGYKEWGCYTGNKQA